jgi:hypothetical protein
LCVKVNFYWYLFLTVSGSVAGLDQLVRSTDPKPSITKLILKSDARIFGSGSVPKWHKSATLVSGILSRLGIERIFLDFYPFSFFKGRSLYSWALLKFLDLDVEAFCAYCSALPTRGERPGSSKWSNGGEPFTYYRFRHSLLQIFQFNHSSILNMSHTVTQTLTHHIVYVFALSL